MKKTIFLVCMLLMSVALLTAQSLVGGMVVDPHGHPLPGVKIEVIGGAESYVILTGPDGRFQTRTIMKVTEVRAVCEGMQTKTQTVSPDMVIRLEKATQWNSKEASSSWIVSFQGVFPELGVSQPAFGLMVAQVKKIGIYAKGVYSPAETTNGDYSDLHSGVSPWTTGKDSRGYMAVVAGGLYQVMSPVYVYAGLGYVNRKVAWQLMDGTYRKNTTLSYAGAVLDYGLLIHYKHFALNGGAMMCVSDGCKFAANLGIGYSF